MVVKKPSERHEEIAEGIREVVSKQLEDHLEHLTAETFAEMHHDSAVGLIEWVVIRAYLKDKRILSMRLNVALIDTITNPVWRNGYLQSLSHNVADTLQKEIDATRED